MRRVLSGARLVGDAGTPPKAPGGDDGAAAGDETLAAQLQAAKTSNAALNSEIAALKAQLKARGRCLWFHAHRRTTAVMRPVARPSRPSTRLHRLASLPRMHLWSAALRTRGVLKQAR